MFVDEASLWSPPNPAGPRGKYIVVVGSSGSGKSTMVRHIEARWPTVTPCVAIDERTTHHPFIDRLFHDPDHYAFEIQINFMIQRVLIARRWLDAGFSVVMERSHLDDRVFIEHLAQRSYVTQAERDAYLGLWSAIENRAPMPDAIVCLDADPEVCVERVTRAERSGARPSEFPDEATKSLWINAWCQLYRSRFIELAQMDKYKSRMHVFDTDATADTIREWVNQKLELKG